MDVGNRQNGVDPYAVQLIKTKARLLVGQVGFTESDCDDLEQELLRDLLERLPKYNPDRGRRSTFIACVVNRKVAKLIRHRKQQRRDYRRNGRSLDDLIENPQGGCVRLGESVSQDDYDLRMGTYSQPEVDRLDMRLDISMAIAELPPHLHDLVELLRTHSIAAAARELGIPRSTLYGSGLARLREVFEDRGLREYL